MGNNSKYKIPNPQQLSLSNKYTIDSALINVVKSQNIIFNNQYYAFYKNDFFDDDCEQVPISQNDVYEISRSCSTNKIVIFHSTDGRLGIMIYKGKKYIMSEFPEYKCILEIDDNIGLIMKSKQIISLSQFTYSGDTVTLNSKISLNSSEFYLSDILDFGIGKKIICLGNNGAWEFYDLLTFTQVYLTNDSSPIKFGKYYDILTYESIIFFGNIVYDISYDSVLNRIRVIQRADQKNKYYTLPINDHKFRQSFKKGQTLIVDDENHNDQYLYIKTIENIICNDNEYINSNLKCIQCKINEIFEGDKCVACPEGTFKLNNSDRICTECMRAMKGCISCTNLTSCTKCDKDTSIFNNPKCIACNSTCHTCEDAISCKSCADGKFLNTNTQLCEECDNSCATCTDKTKCLSCSSPLYLQQLEKKCVTECYPGYYLNTSKICQKCNRTCATCKNGASCTTCLSDHLKNEQNKLCDLLCDRTCKTCLFSKFNCLTCNDPYYLQTNHTCADSCLPNEYPDDTKTCQPCNISCLTCINGTSCSTCTDSMYLDSVTKYCKPCTTVNCKTCDNPSQQCTECNLLYYLTQDNKCVDNCQFDQHNTYGDAQRKCQLCNATCFTCQNAFSCDQCNIGYYINTISALCEKCNDNCKTCENGIVDNQCISCNNPMVLLQTKQCADVDVDLDVDIDADADNDANANKCNSKQYLDVNQICQQCDSSCNSCSNSSTCNSCVEGRYLVISTSKCDFCDLNCKACIEKDKCQSCVQNYFLTQNKQCKQECDQYTFPDSNGICQSCPSNCLNCKQFNQCIECFYGFYLYNGLCIEEVICYGNTYLEQNECKTECSQRKFKNFANNRCDPCHITCKKCTEANKCLECENGLILNDDSKCEQQLQETNATSKLIFKIYLATTIYTFISCIICHFLDNRSINSGEKECKPKVAKTQIINVENQVVVEDIISNENKIQNFQKQIQKNKQINQNKIILNFKKNNNKIDINSRKKSYFTNQTKISPISPEIDMIVFRNFKTKQTQQKTMNNQNGSTVIKFNDPNNYRNSINTITSQININPDQYNYDQKIYFTLIANEFLEVYMLQDNSPNSVLRVLLMYFKQCLIMLISFYQFIFGYFIICILILMCVLIKGILKKIIEKFNFLNCYRYIVSKIFFLVIYSLFFIFFIFKQCSIITNDKDYKWSVYYLSIFIIDFIFIQNIISFLNYCSSVRKIKGFNDKLQLFLNYTFVQQNIINEIKTNKLK
ncbi:zinc finger lsd1 subclass family protein, putative [Ichthyophthirius multifiliis]|uniref:Zinc finger lsd1 subclass family protein, putative n=1 Tax=Ichthyophthirius multifiliis TaxID=5932 RepID=G0QTU6_ICHMU|nr:zinc finger lsd1 subclass family protein, putative [Ichthyophthirius multifiliis]EGR31350.1 zinc finger lsd1 subclass family protein, putative [Ichthyophthirius multifiliis]|eukprot:XP_004034836.1 zinc finger lsd1 subclass family protein, putative [Ichthyophthirius multifiliis]